MLSSIVYAELNPPVFILSLKGLAPFTPFARLSLLLSISARGRSKPFRIRTYKSASKQTTLTTFRMNTCERGRGGALLLTTILLSDRSHAKELFGRNGNAIILKATGECGGRTRLGRLLSTLTVLLATIL